MTSLDANASRSLDFLLTDLTHTVWGLVYFFQDGHVLSTNRRFPERVKRPRRFRGLSAFQRPVTPLHRVFRKRKELLRS